MSLAKRMCLIVLFSVFSLSCHNVRTEQLTEQDHIRLMFRSVAIVKNVAGICSGVILSRHHVLTAAHCLDNSLYYEIITYPQFLETQSLDDFYLFRLDVADSVRDLAILRSSEPLPEGVLPARIKLGPYPDVGDRTFVIGHPLFQYFNLSIGYISAPEYTNRDFATFLRSSSQVYFGNSGGPMFDERGRLIGIVSSIRGQQAYLGQYVSYTEILEFLRETGYLM